MTAERQDSESQELIKNTIGEVLGKMGFDSAIEANEEMSGNAPLLVFNIKTKESNFLIGQYGNNLQSLQHLIRLLIRKKISTKINFTIDVNNYRKEKNESIEKLATEMAEQCLAEKKEMVLRPMSAYERRLIHIELAKNTKITTESIGEGENRRVVIKPIGLNS